MLTAGGLVDTLITVHAIFATLAVLAGCAVEARVALTHTGAVFTIHTCTVPETRLAFGSWTSLTVSAVKSLTALPFLKGDR